MHNQPIHDKTAAYKKKKVKLFSFLCAAVYFISYFARMDYKAVLSEIVKSENITNEKASIALTALFISYGIGQFVFGWLGDKVKPTLLLILGLSISSVSNLLIPFCAPGAAMSAVWCVNGVGQSMIWPPLVRIISDTLAEDEYMKTIFKVNRGSALGAFTVYIVSALVISIFSWRRVFHIASLLCLAGVLIVFFGIRRLSSINDNKVKVNVNAKEDKSENKKQKNKMPLLVIIPLLISMLAITLHGSLRDGVDAWMPTYISELFSLDTSVSIMSGAFMPLFSLIAFAASTFVYKKIFKNELYCAAAFFLLSSLFCAALTIVSSNDYPVFLSVALFTLIVGCMHGVDIMLVSYLPNRFKKYGRISLVAGVMNFSTYVGSAVSAYGFARLSNKGGWSKTILLWIILALCGALVCLIAALFQKRIQAKDFIKE